MRINHDTSPYTASFSSDGKYVPRTYLLDKQGNILESPFKNSKHAFFLPPENNEYLAKLLIYLGSWSK